METKRTLNKDRTSTSGGLLRTNRQTIILAGALLGVNWPLLTGSINTDLLFFPQAVGDGQLWRILTYPLVHVSWYHLLLDGGAFLILFSCLENRRMTHRLAISCGAAIGSLGLALEMEPAIAEIGLCGLSGVAHGLMAVTGLEIMISTRHRLLGLGSLLIVLSKSTWELISGQVIFASLHFGNYGTPLAACHAGGVLGAMLVYGALHYFNYRAHQINASQEAAS